MCGIAGVFVHPQHACSESQTREWIERTQAMLQRLEHRGPDDGGLLCDAPVFLGHRRLAILDVTENGHQPMSDPTERYWITYNGEIYNYRSLRKELMSEGTVFRTDSDTEVLLHALIRWGRSALARLDGMFAFAFWDRRERSLWLVRDGVGIKPLFYVHTPSHLAFASEPKGILASGHTASPNREALKTFLAFGYVASPETGFEGIVQLEPGHDLMIRADAWNATPRRWYRWPYPSAPTRWGQRESADRLRDSLQRSVALQLQSDVPIGAFLSGGMDSSSIVASVDRRPRNALTTLSMAFDEESFDESAPARCVADALGTEHREFRIDGSSFETLRQIAAHAEDPIADNSLLPCWFLFLGAASQLKVALSGDGADELLSGYTTYFATQIATRYRHLPLWIRRHCIEPYIRSLPASDKKYSAVMFANRFISAADLPRPFDHCSWRLMLDRDLNRQIRTDRWESGLERALQHYAKAWDEVPDWLDPAEKILHLDRCFHLPNDMLVKVDRMSMAHSLEVRVPFLGNDVLETSLAIPSVWKRRAQRGKRVLHDAMQWSLPATILQRKKAGFVMPIESSLRKEWAAELRAYVNEEFCEATQMLDHRSIISMIDEHMANRKNHAYALFTILMLSLWWRTWIDGVDRPTRPRRNVSPVRITIPSRSAVR